MFKSTRTLTAWIMQNNLHLNFLSVLYSKTKMQFRLKFDEWKLSTSCPLWNVSYLWKLFQTEEKGQKRYFFLKKRRRWLSCTILSHPHFMMLVTSKATSKLAELIYIQIVSLKSSHSKSNRQFISRRKERFFLWVMILISYFCLCSLHNTFSQKKSKPFSF